MSGHVADSLMNMDTIRAFAAEDREAAEHRSRVADQRRKSLRSWDYANLRIDALVALPHSDLTAMTDSGPLFKQRALSFKAANGGRSPTSHGASPSRSANRRKSALCTFRGRDRLTAAAAQIRSLCG